MVNEDMLKMLAYFVIISIVRKWLRHTYIVTYALKRVFLQGFDDIGYNTPY